jgi:hypothetical protein
VRPIKRRRDRREFVFMVQGKVCGRSS